MLIRRLVLASADDYPVAIDTILIDTSKLPRRL
jgi:hypothetical protein